MRQKIVATLGAIATIGLFLLSYAKRLADAISIIHLPHDVGEFLTSMSQTPILISYSALAIGIACLVYLAVSHWWPKTKPSNAALLVAPSEDSAVFDPAWHRDASLLDALWRAYSGNWGGRIQLERPSPEADKFYDTADAIRQRAFDGSLPVWGRSPESSLYEPIPREFWRNHAIEADYSIVSTGSDTWVRVTHPLIVGEVPGAKTRAWEDFMTSKEAVEKLWPAGQDSA